MVFFLEMTWNFQQIFNLHKSNVFAGLIQPFEKLAFNKKKQKMDLKQSKTGTNLELNLQCLKVQYLVFQTVLFSHPLQPLVLLPAAQRVKKQFFLGVIQKVVEQKCYLLINFLGHFKSNIPGKSVIVIKFNFDQGNRGKIGKF